MQLIHRILCPVDFSETSMQALHFADALAQSIGAHIVLVHAFEKPKNLTLASPTVPADPELRRQLDELPTSLPATQLTRVLHAGDPGEVTCWLAQDRKCGLIVMGTHGRTGLAHLVMGSVAEYVLRNARCPVLVVRNRPQDEPALTEPTVLPVPPPRFM